MCACVRVQARACVARAGGGLKEKFCPRGCHTQHLPSLCVAVLLSLGVVRPQNLVGVSLRLGIYGSSQQHPPQLSTSRARCLPAH